MAFIYIFLLTTYIMAIFAQNLPEQPLPSSYIMTDWGFQPDQTAQHPHQIPSLSGTSSTSGTGSVNNGNGRVSQPACVSIPENLTLCHGIGYTQMRLPNLLEHDTMAEVSQQAVSWVPLYNLMCHPDTQLFLCSLFTPVCLDRLIFPCRSLCDAVRQGCEGRMKAYGFPWPDMVRCDKFPMDNDMCIGVQSPAITSADASPTCNVCQQPETYENIIDNYCRADFVIKTRIKKTKKSQLKCKKAKVLKLSDDLPKKDFRRPILQHRNFSVCCGNLFRNVGKKGRLLIMGIRGKTQSNSRQSHFKSPSQLMGPGIINEDYVPTFVMEWGKTKDFRRALKTMRKIDCSNTKFLSESMIAEGGIVVNPVKGPAFSSSHLSSTSLLSSGLSNRRMSGLNGRLNNRAKKRGTTV